MAASVILLAILALLFQINFVMAQGDLVKSDLPRRAALFLPKNKFSSGLMKEVEGLFSSVAVLTQKRIQ
ncbi:MAG: hypothetical protein Q8L97_10375 [Nitrosomonas sp.]|uniref:hypothetical protein n=1 Tax=Nitrosomonas sp. TaxID=42353 RepID=UPI00272FF369|nr:hypothetical protein [Nitrosomonas sp.]MDP1550545.1 hypothetical protein [Nitrosomonas sp.]